MLACRTNVINKLTLIWKIFFLFLQPAVLWKPRIYITLWIYTCGPVMNSPSPREGSSWWWVERWTTGCAMLIEERLTLGTVSASPPGCHWELLIPSSCCSPSQRCHRHCYIVPVIFSPSHMLSSGSSVREERRRGGNDVMLQGSGTRDMCRWMCMCVDAYIWGHARMASISVCKH